MLSMEMKNKKKILKLRDNENILDMLEKQLTLRE